MSDVIDLGSKRAPTIYTVAIAHHWDGTLEFKINDVADDDRSREAVMHAFRRISGADAEIDRLQRDLNLAVLTESEYVRTIEADDEALRAERDELRALLSEARELLPGHGSPTSLVARIDAALKENT